MDYRTGELARLRLETKIAILAVVLLGLFACPKMPQEGDAREGELTRKMRIRLVTAPECPEDMAWVAPAKVCIDLYEFPNVSGELPLRGVTYEQAEELCEAYGKRLPTAEEWETACGGLDGRTYPYGDDYKEDACRTDRAYSEGPVLSGSMPRCVSFFGIYDMTGNVWEWTSSEGFEKGTKYVRGGSWLSFPSVATCTLKAWEPPEGGGDDYGFRCAMKP